MKILERGTMVEGLLDYHRPQRCLRIDVLLLQNIAPVSDQFFVRKRSLRLVGDYVREVGLLTTIRKVASRTREGRRNARHISVGIGTVLEGECQDLEVGALVAFVAPNHPAWVNRLVLPPELCIKLNERLDVKRIHIRAVPGDEKDRHLLDRCAGWDYWSGLPAPSEARTWLERHGDQLLNSFRAAGASDLVDGYDSDEVAVHRKARTIDAEALPTLAVIGSGNYVKTVALPELRRKLSVREIFELDPLMIVKPEASVDYWCAPGPAEEKLGCDAYLIAGYHHTHAPMAARALRAGRWAIVEKPIVTTEEQLLELKAALQRSKKFIACYQKRYDPFTLEAQKLLGTGPIDYSCIVFEVPLPRLHWYNWPSSGTRVLSNGCHWIDHFLWLNRGAEILRLQVASSKRGTVHVWIELENSASFSMSLTEVGSARVGLQDIVDLRAADRTVQIRNSSELSFDSPTKSYERRQLRIEPYRRMYSQVASEVASGRPLVDVDHELRSAACVLRVEAEVNADRATSVR